MPLYQLDRRLRFPPAEHALDSGVLAIGGDLSVERLILAYQSGIFPWYDEGQPLIWHSPDPRFVLRGSALHVPRSLEKRLRRGDYAVRLDTRFREVIERCATARRDGQRGTWITRDMADAYVHLHERGLAHSAEAYDSSGALVGGLYGVSLGSAYFGESMFAAAPDASKVAFVTLVRQLGLWGIDLLDCQVHTAHLERFGATEWSRATYLRELARCCETPTRLGPWRLGAPATSA